MWAIFLYLLFCGVLPFRTFDSVGFPFSLLIFTDFYCFPLFSFVLFLYKIMYIFTLPNQVTILLLKAFEPYLFPEQL